MLMRLWHFHLVVVVIREETTEVRKISCESKYRKSQQNEKKEEYKAVKHLWVIQWGFYVTSRFLDSDGNKSIHDEYIPVLLQCLQILYCSHGAGIQCSNHKCCIASTEVGVSAVQLAFKSPKYDVVSWSEILKAPVQNNHLDQMGGQLNIVQAGCLWHWVEKSSYARLSEIPPNGQTVSNTQTGKIGLKKPTFSFLISLSYIKLMIHRTQDSSTACPTLLQYVTLQREH